MSALHAIQFLRYEMAGESVCQPPLSIILSSDSSWSNYSSAAPTLKAWPLSGCWFDLFFNPSCGVVRIVLMLAGFRLFPICSRIFMDLELAALDLNDSMKWEY
jgi:hypothetical protein